MFFKKRSIIDQEILKLHDYILANGSDNISLYNGDHVEIAKRFYVKISKEEHDILQSAIDQFNENNWQDLAHKKTLIKGLKYLKIL
jgi:TRAP-type C4-dicarboxylate transport system substrate-binding protein